MRLSVIDTEGKQYFSNSKYFADMFNFLLYDGRPVIDPKNLKELDTTHRLPFHTETEQEFLFRSIVIC